MVKSDLDVTFQEIRNYYPDWEYLEIGIKSDHVHLYMWIFPKICCEQDNRNHQKVKGISIVGSTNTCKIVAEKCAKTFKAKVILYQL